MLQGQGEELSMRTIKEVLRLGLCMGLSSRAIGRSLRISHFTAQKYLKVVRESGLTWEQIQTIDEDALFTLVKTQYVKGPPQPERPMLFGPSQGDYRKGITYRILPATDQILLHHPEVH